MLFDDISTEDRHSLITAIATKQNMKLTLTILQSKYPSQFNDFNHNSFYPKCRKWGQKMDIKPNAKATLAMYHAVRSHITPEQLDEVLAQEGLSYQKDWLKAQMAHSQERSIRQRKLITGKRFQTKLKTEWDNHLPIIKKVLAQEDNLKEAHRLLKEKGLHMTFQNFKRYVEKSFTQDNAQKNQSALK